MRGAGRAFISAPADAELFDIRTNPSVLVSVPSTSLSFFHCRPYGLRELETFSFAAAWKLHGKRLGLILSRFGRKLFQNDTAELAFATGWGPRFFWGLKLAGERISILRYGQRQRLALTLGWHFLSSNRLIFHGAVQQVISDPARKTDGQFFSLTAGAAVQVVSRTWLFVETVKEPDFDPEYRLALSSQAGRWLRLRAGFTRSPERFCAGITLFLKNANFDYSMVFHPVLGYTHVWGFSLFF